MTVEDFLKHFGAKLFSMINEKATAQLNVEINLRQGGIGTVKIIETYSIGGQSPPKSK